MSDTPSIGVRATVVLAHVRFRDWIFDVRPDGARHYIQVAFDGIDARTGDAVTLRGRKWPLSDHMTDSEIVQTAFKAVITALEHEAREDFVYRDAPIFGPHHDVEDLVALWKRRGPAGART